MLESEREYLASLLDKVDCIEYLPLFENNDITPDLLPSLDKQAIKELGVTKVGDRLRIQVLVKLTNMDRIKKDVPVGLLNKSITVAVNSMVQLEEQVRNAQNNNPNFSSNGSSGAKSAFVSITVITQDGEAHPVDISKKKGVSDVDSKKKILLSVLGNSKTNEWKLYYVDYSKGSAIHEVGDAELDNILNEGLVEKDRLILCKHKESVNTEAVNTSNKIHRKRKTSSQKDREINQFMGGRPPSQMISTNLREYFPDLDHGEIEDIKRKSMRLSMYSSKMMNRMSKNRFTMSSKRDSLYSRLSNLSMMSSRMSVYSDASYGVGKPVRMDYHDIPEESEEETEKGDGTHVPDAIIEDEHPNSIIELLDESDDDELAEEDGDDNGNEDEMMNVISNEVANGPSVWHKGPKIGQGSFGNVYLGLNGLTGELMAIKQVDMPQNETEKSKKIMVGALKQEISLLKELSHENIVRYLGSNTDSSKMYIFLEYVPGGSVSSMLKIYGPFEDKLIRNFTRQVLVGLVYLHSKGIIHRDIKGGNILVDNNGSVKIGDFGISKKIAIDDDENDTGQDDPGDHGASPDANKAKKRSSLQGSVFWMAPEVVKQVAYTDKADVWSVGCLVVEMYTGRHPYPGLSQMQAIFQIGTGKAQPGIPSRALEDPAAVEFLGHVLAADYVTRPKAAELLALPFVQQE